MKAFIVYSHPEEKSFNSAMFRTAVETLENAGASVKTSDLYKMKFDPIATRSAYKSVCDPDYFKQQIEEIYASEHHTFSDVIEGEIAKLEWCDFLILQFPLNWFGLPAMLKGWADRVIAMSRCYDGAHVYETGRFKGKRAMLSLTTGAPRAAYMEGGMNGRINGILRPVNRGILEFMGFTVLSPEIVYSPAHLTETDRGRALENYAARLLKIGSEPAWEVGAF